MTLLALCVASILFATVAFAVKFYYSSPKNETECNSDILSVTEEVYYNDESDVNNTFIMENNVEEYLSDLDSSLQNIVLEETILNDTRLDFILGDDSWEEESVFNRGTGDKSSSTLDFNTAYYKLSNFDEDLEEIALQSFEKCKDDSELKKIWLPLTNQSRICNKNDARIRSIS